MAAYIPTSSDLALISNGFASDIHTSVGKMDIIKMHYEIYIGKIDNKGDKTKLADTTSFKEGVSLSEIKWGFINTASYGDSADAKISFTLHDIAGKTLKNFVKLKTGGYWIYFRGPDSLGNLWSGPEAIYYPDTSDCKIDFSPTQGFTYTFSGTPMVMQPRSEYLTNVEEFAVSGRTTPGKTFWQYLTELEKGWNDARHRGQAGCGNVMSVKFHQGNDTNTLWSTPAHRLEKTAENVDTIEPFKVGVGMKLSTAITHFFNTTFQTPELLKNEKPTLEINLMDTVDNVINIDIKIWGTSDEKNVLTEYICIGSDMNCVGAQFRGQLVSMDFGPLYTLMAANLIHDEIESTGTGKGSAETKSICVDKERKINDEQTKTSTNDLIGRMGNAADGSWAGIETILNAGKIPDFSIDIEMPYSFGFTPKVHGGLLKDTLESKTGSGIHMLQGTALEFYWYVDTDCAKLEKVEAISTTYRVSKVVHSIGLNGNTTQVTLSHLHITT